MLIGSLFYYQLSNLVNSHVKYQGMCVHLHLPLNTAVATILHNYHSLLLTLFVDSSNFLQSRFLPIMVCQAS